MNDGPDSRSWNARRASRRIPKDVSEVAVERDENPPTRDGRGPTHGIISSAKTQFPNRPSLAWRRLLHGHQTAILASAPGLGADRP